MKDKIVGLVYNHLIYLKVKYQISQIDLVKNFKIVIRVLSEIV